ncbi:hypothetical protein CPC08DRAFT_660262 [Agrocybe pediades]|nr:hypothetical protein CPC08DRAFT_660262 [Agrocybe pediades]
MKKQESSITPQRKHRKLLKDGSGTEVWPESVEKVFVQGLRDYWDSPYATYSQSRGRSRWRNQYLVDYLQKQGIERSKKQVASHIQVLRNMWKGEPEFHLVAGGDEAYADSESPVPAPVKLEEQLDSNHLVAFEWDEPSSNSVSPNFSPADSQSEFPPTPEQRPNLYPSDFGIVQPALDLGYQTSSPSISPNGHYVQQLPPFTDSSSPFAMQQAKISSDGTAQLLGRHMSATPTHPRFPRNKVTSLFLHAEGMTPFSVKVDAFSQPTQPVQPPFTLRIRLGVPSMNDARTPPNFHGFQSFISLEQVWSATSKCITKVYSNGVCISEEPGFLNVTHINIGTVNASLPESSLNRCRWLDPSFSVVITQEIIVDDETLLFVIYDVDRKNVGPSPSATLLGYQKYRAGDRGTTPMTPSAISPSPVSSVPFTHAGPYGRANVQPSHPYTLSPMRYPPTSAPPRF